MLLDKHGIRELDDIGIDLLSDRFEQMHILIAAPAPDLSALLMKLEVLYRDLFEEPEVRRYLSEIVADARRLIGGG